MKKDGVFIQERGLMLLIGLAVLTSGLLLFTNASSPSRQVLASNPIHLQHVDILLPRFVERQPININSATMEELIMLPGIGPALAQRIVDDRSAHGPFVSVEDLERVSGIGPKTIAGFIDLAVAGSSDE